MQIKKNFSFFDYLNKEKLEEQKNLNKFVKFINSTEENFNIFMYKIMLFLLHSISLFSKVKKKTKLSFRYILYGNF